VARDALVGAEVVSIKPNIARESYYPCVSSLEKVMVAVRVGVVRYLLEPVLRVHIAA
jgi:hypothetical protein